MKDASHDGGTSPLLPISKQQEKSEDTVREQESVQWNALLACFSYTVCSVGMVITNKAVAVVLHEEVRHKLPRFNIILFQCILAVVLVEMAKRLKIVEYPDFNFKVARQWFPLNLLFIGMLCTGFLSLVYVSVPIVTVFKNLASLVTVAGDHYLFGEPVGWLTIVSIMVMVIGALLAGINDLEFSFLGYLFMVLNCLFTSGYVLYMRFASTNIQLPRFGMVFYNNLISCALLLPICLFSGELEAFRDARIMTAPFLIANLAAGLLGFYLNFSSLWCVSATSATTYAVVGSLNKIPTTVLGFILFDVHLTKQGVYFITLATVGGGLYAYAKLPKT